MGKEQYSLQKITKAEAATLLLKYHYLKDISKDFKSGFNYGLFSGSECVGGDLFSRGECVGVCIFTAFPVPELGVGMLGLARSDQSGLFELSRLCLHPDVQSQEHNLASWFVARAIKQLKQDTMVRVILSYADDDHHKGTIYRACNFTYYGLTEKHTDFWIKQADGSFIKHSRGKTRGVEGEWRARSRKKRFAILLDKSLSILWKPIKEEKEMSI